MWLMTTSGFYSAIRWHDGRICIRARRRDDLERLAKFVPNLSEISETPKRDYRYRVFTDQKSWEKGMVKLAKTVAYGNFKSAAKATTPDHERLYHKVWAILGELQPGGPYGWRAPKAKKAKK